MDVGDRVVYTANNEIDLNRDLGSILGFSSSEWARPMVEVYFDDGEAWTVDREDLKPLVDKHPQQATLFS
jgi:hypothetical protein